MKPTTILFLGLLAIVVAVAYANAEDAGKGASSSSSEEKKGSGDKKAHADHKKGNATNCIEGKYILKRNQSNQEGYLNYMKAMGFSDECIKNAKEDKAQFSVTIEKKDGKWCVKLTVDKKTASLSFESGKEFESELIDGRKKSSTITVDEEKKKMHRVIKMGDFDATQDAEFCPRGIKVEVKAKDAVGHLKFRRARTSSALLGNIMGRIAARASDRKH